MESRSRTRDAQERSARFRASQRRGSMILFLCLCVLSILAGAALFLHRLNKASYREFHHLDGFLRAVSVGEACYLDTISTLAEKPWSERPFKGSYQTGNGRWQDGRYSYILADGPGPFEADLVVKASTDESDVVLYWRLVADPFTFSPFRQIRSTYFSHENLDTTLSMPGITALRRSAAQAAEERKVNRAWSDTRLAPLGPGATPAEMAQAVNATDAATVQNRMEPTIPGGSPAFLADRAPGMEPIEVPAGLKLPPAMAAAPQAGGLPAGAGGSDGSTPVKNPGGSGSSTGGGGAGQGIPDAQVIKEALQKTSEDMFRAFTAIEPGLLNTDPPPSGSQEDIDAMNELRDQLRECKTRLDDSKAALERLTASTDADQGNAAARAREQAQQIEKIKQDVAGVVEQVTEIGGQYHGIMVHQDRNWESPCPEPGHS